MENNLVLTTEEAAEFLKLTPFTVRDYARRGILPSRKVGKGWRFYKPDLLAWLRDYRGSTPLVNLFKEITEMKGNGPMYV